MSNLIAKHHFLQDIKKVGMGDFLFERPTRNYNEKIAAEGSKTMAPLNGLFTTKEIADTFKEFNSMQPMGDLTKLYMQLNGWVKLGKTVFSVMTHARNMLGNIGFVTMNGHWRLDKFGKAIQTAFANVHSNDKATREKFQEYIQLGVVQDSGAAGELRQYINDIKNNNDFFEKINDGKLKKIKNGFLDTTKNLYQFEDDLYKIFAFENEYARYKQAFPNLTDQEVKEKAAEIVRNTYPTYSLVPNIVKRFRANPLVGSFVSFPAEVIRTTYNTILLAKEELSNPTTRSIGAQRAAGILMASLTPTAISYASRALLGLDGEDDDDLRRFVAPWQTGSEFIYVNVDGDKYKVIDLGYSDPHSYLKRPIYELLRDDKLTPRSVGRSAWALAEPFLSQEILAQRIKETVVDNRKENGDQVYNPYGTLGDIASDVYSHFKPVAEPGTITSLRRIISAYRGETNRGGDKLELSNELIGLITGLKTETKDIGTSLAFNHEIRDAVEATKKTYALVARDPRATPEQKAQAKKEHDDALANIAEEALSIYYSAIRLGADPKEAKKFLFKTKSPEIIQSSRSQH